MEDDQESDVQIYRLQLGAIFKALLSLSADEPALLQRLLQPDALFSLLRSLECEETRLHYQTAHVNIRHVDFLSNSSRFLMPAPIASKDCLDKIHQNFAISYLADSALPLSLEPAISASLTELQSANGKEIVLSLIQDEPFLCSVFDGLCAGPMPTSPEEDGERMDEDDGEGERGVGRESPNYTAPP